MTQQQLLTTLRNGYSVAEDKEDGFKCMCDLKHRPGPVFYWGWQVLSNSLMSLVQKGMLQQDMSDSDFIFYSLFQMGDQLRLPLARR